MEINNVKAIEFGGGDNPRFHPNYDIRQLPNVDVVIDLNSPLSIPKEEYEFVYSRYLLEHISWRNVKNFLKEIYRILKPEGKIEIITANLLEQAKVLVDTKEWNDNLIGMIFGDQNFDENAHQNGFSPEYITKILSDIGFNDIKITPIQSDFGPTDMMIEATKSSTYNDKHIIETIENITETIKRQIQTTKIPTVINVDRRQWILSHCEPNKKIIDIGSADGWIFRYTVFAQCVTSIDLDIYNIPNFKQMDAHNLKFQDKSFDIAILGEIIEHVEDPVRVIKEAKRVGRKVLITVPDEANWSSEYYPYETIEKGMERRNLTLEQIVKVSNPNTKEFYTEDNHKHLFHNRHYTEDTLRQDLENAGIINYEMTRIQYSGWSFFAVETTADTVQIPCEELIITKGPIISTGSLTTISKDDKKSDQPIVTEGIEEHVHDTKRPLSLSRNILRIALISTPFFTLPTKGYSGLEQVVWDLAEALDDLGHEITLFAPEGSQPTKHGHLITTGPSVSTVNIDWFEEERKRYEIYRQYINSKNFDIIHDNTWFAFVYLLKENDPQLKIIKTHHGGFNWESIQPFGKSNIVALSKWMKIYTEQYFRQKGYNVQSEYVYNGINLEKYPYQFNKTERLLFVGRLSSFKQPHIAVELARKTNHKLDIVGGTFVDSIDYVKQLDKMVENDPNIQIFKDVTHEFKIEKMQNAKALIFPSKMNKPFGLTSLEAMACGTPVIATRDGAISEVVIHNKTGFICDNMSDMIEALNNIHTIDPKNCRKRAEELSREIMAKNYIKLYEKMLNNQDW